MRISVYDTYVQRPDGKRMHFDILVPSEVTDREAILRYGHAYLAAKGLHPAHLQPHKCNYCHMESASPEVEREIAESGFAIIEMEHCA